MPPIRLVRAVDEDGRITLENLPYRQGDRVEVTITALPGTNPTDPYPLQGATPYRFDDPTAPVAEEDWEVLS